MTEHIDGPIGEDVDALDGQRDLDTPDRAEPSLTETAQLSARERAQQRVALARASVRDTTVRVRNSAAFPTRRTIEPTGDSVTTSDDDGDAATITLADRAQAHRAYIISAAVAIVGLLVVVLRRRAAAHQGDDVVDLGEWHLHAEPVNE